MYYGRSFSIHKSHKYRHTCLLVGRKQYTIVRRWLPISSKHFGLPNWIYIYENFDWAAIIFWQLCTVLCNRLPIHKQIETPTCNGNLTALYQMLFLLIYGKLDLDIREEKNLWHTIDIIVMFFKKMIFVAVCCDFFVYVVYTHWHWLISFSIRAYIRV